MPFSLPGIKSVMVPHFSPEMQKGLTTVFIFFTFLGICVAFYTNYEGWSPSTCLSFAVVTMSTVGFGYHSPTDDTSRTFTVFIMIFGVFVVYGGINNIVVARLEAARNRRSDKVEEGVLSPQDDMENPLTIAEIVKTHRRRMFFTVMFIFAALFIAALTFMIIEEWTFPTAFYFAVQTATTVGYGDLRLKSGASHIILGIYTIFSTILLAFAFNNFSFLNDEYKRLEQAAQFAQKKRTLDRIKELDKGDGVHEGDFILAVLEQLDVIDRKRHIDPWSQKFRQIDKDHSGTISAQEIEEFSLQESSAATRLMEELSLGHSSSSSSSSSNTTADMGDPSGMGDPAAVTHTAADAAAGVVGAATAWVVRTYNRLVEITGFDTNRPRPATGATRTTTTVTSSTNPIATTATATGAGGGPLGMRTTMTSSSSSRRPPSDLTATSSASTAGAGAGAGASSTGSGVGGVNHTIHVMPMTPERSAQNYDALLEEGGSGGGGADGASL